MALPRGVDMSVPDLSQLGKVPPEVVVTRVLPGDKVIVLLPVLATQQEVGQVSAYLKQFAPQAEFCVLSGPLSVTVVPPAPIEDRSPQGKEVTGTHDEDSCPGPPECM